MKYLRFIWYAVISWWPMMAFHELGHVIGALIAGAKIENVVLWPWTFSETIRVGSKSPLLDTWLGPVFGAYVPLALYGYLRNRRFPGRGWLGYFAGFCLIANGLYIGLGWIDRVGDAGDLLKLGAPIPIMAIFGIVSACLGIHIWHHELFR
jgi:hypothetical protein